MDHPHLRLVRDHSPLHDPRSYETADADPEERDVASRRTARSFIPPHRLAQLTRDEGYDDFIRADGRTRLGTQIEQRLRDDTPRHREIAGDPSFGERMTLWFRLNGEAATFAFAMFAVGLLLVAVVCAFVGVGR